jgi:protein-S-isoprenylcysteine O-methyltransferase Ste14
MNLLRGAAAGALVGLVGQWNGPTVWVLALTAAIVIVDLGRRDRVEQIGPGGVAALAFDPYGRAMPIAFVAVLAAGAFENRAPEIAWRHPGLYGVAGFAVIMAGLALRQSAARALGRDFTVVLSVRDDHELVASGPYRWLRHPNYAGILLSAFGTAIMVRSPLAIGVTLVTWLPLALLRIHAEERALHAQLGETFAEYRRGRWCIVPGVY